MMPSSAAPTLIVGVHRPSMDAIMRIRVLFPAPFGPSKPKISPSATSNVMPATASKFP